MLATYQRLTDPAIGSVIRTTVGLIEKADAPDKYTVRFALTIPYVSWPAVTAALQSSIVPRDAGDTLSTKPDGTGPYKFLSCEPNGSMVLADLPIVIQPHAKPMADQARGHRIEHLLEGEPTGRGDGDAVSLTLYYD